MSEVTAEEHATHWTIHPATRERVEESSIVVDGDRIWWCGYVESVVEPVAD